MLTIHSPSLRDRLVGVHGPATAAGPGLEMQLGYDARNRCVRWLYTPAGSNFAPSMAAFYYDGWNLVAEYGNAAGAQTASYVHRAMVDEVLLRTAVGGGSVYYHHDGVDELQRPVGRAVRLRRVWPAHSQGRGGEKGTGINGAKISDFRRR